MKQEEKILKTEYSQIMKQSYIDYAMSVIVARALPDIRDGLKPVQRRTLYDMHQLGIDYDKPFRKCARIVGDTMGKYHPHGDSSIYDALVVMAQEFKKGMALVDGHGNFGSIEGDGAAAMRYTEARLQKVTSMVYLQDLEKDVIDFVPNFDNNEKEPSALPVRISNFLLNGAEGIAVGMATSVPPHNLIEVAEATKALIQNPLMTTRELMQYIQGPDFPTGAAVVNRQDLQQIYESGSGKLRLRGVVEYEKLKGGKQQLVITEIPYTMIGSGIGKFLNDVSALVEQKVTSDIIDISNQSSKDGIRIVLEIRKGADPENLKNLLYQKTKLEDTFGVNMLAVVDGRPEVLGLSQVLAQHIDFLYEITGRKYRYMLDKERHKKEIQEGLLKALDILDLIIEIIRGSKTIKQAKNCLIEGDVTDIQFKSAASKKQARLLNFTPNQATAILEMRLSKLIGLELLALQQSHDDTIANIARYEQILEEKDSMDAVLLADLDMMIREFGRPRRTRISEEAQVAYVEKPVEEETVYVLLDRFGYIRSIDVATYERNASSLQDLLYTIPVLNTGKVAVFSDLGRVHTVKVADIPLTKLRDKGQPLDNLCYYDGSKERIVSVLTEAALATQKTVFVSAAGMIKTVEAGELLSNKKMMAATKLAADDSLLAVLPIENVDWLVLQSRQGYFLKLALEDIPQMKKTAIGVRGMRFGKEDALYLAHGVSANKESTALFEEKTVALNRLRQGSRDTKGVKTRV